MTVILLDPVSPQTQSAETTQAILSHIESLLNSDPAQSEIQASELLNLVHGEQMAILFQGIARRLVGNFAAAIEVLQPLSESCSDAPFVHLQLGLALRDSGQKDTARNSIRRAVSVKSDFAEAWLALADLHVSTGEAKAADDAFAMYVQHSNNDPFLQAAVTALRENRLADAESMLCTQLEQQSADIVAMCMLAEVVELSGRSSEAETYLVECLNLAPGYKHARHNYAVVLLRQNKVSEALQQTDRLLAEDPENLGVRKLAANILVRLQEYERSIKICEDILVEYPKEHFAGGQNFSYSLKDIGNYYRNYVELMAHFDTVLPGRVHRIIYESLVDNTEHEVRRLLDYCGLDFEQSCLDFYKNKRPVSTASSEQVRSPIYRGGLEHWRNYEAWLGPLKTEIGSLADNYAKL